MIDVERTAHVLGEIAFERDRQEALIERGHIPFDCTDPDLNPAIKLAVLTEELGEVARAVLEEHDTEDLREELIQVAAVATAWAEGLEPDGRLD